MELKNGAHLKWEVYKIDQYNKQKHTSPKSDRFKKIYFNMRWKNKDSNNLCLMRGKGFFYI